MIHLTRGSIYSNIMNMKTPTMQDLGKKYIEFLRPKTSIKTKTTDSKDLKVKTSKIR